MKNKFLKTFILFSLLAAGASAQHSHKLLPAEQEIPLNYGADRLGKRYDADMQKFRDNRLGAFIHWGLYAIPGGEWNGKVYPLFHQLQPLARVLRNGSSHGQKFHRASGWS
mgnify:CR=1 FL=1